MVYLLQCSAQAGAFLEWHTFDHNVPNFLTAVRTPLRLVTRRVWPSGQEFRLWAAHFIGG